MIKQYLVSIDYPDHYKPFTAEDLKSVVWDGVSILHKRLISVEEVKPSAPTTNAIKKDKHTCMFGDYP